MGRWLGLGRLPGDLRLERDALGFYFPITTSLIVSIVASLLIGGFRR